MNEKQLILTVIAALGLSACQGATRAVQREVPAGAAIAGQDPPRVSSSECREDNPVNVRLVRLGQAELIAHLAAVLGSTVVRGEGAPVIFLQGEHTSPADERVINSVDFSSYRNAVRVLARRYVASLPPESVCRDEAGALVCMHGPLKTLMMRLAHGELRPADWDRLAQSYLRLAEGYGAERALEAVLTAELLSPQILYRAESGLASGAAATPRRLSREEAVQLAGFAVLGHAPLPEERAELLRFDGDQFQPYLARFARLWTRTSQFEERATGFVQEWLGVSHLREKLVRPAFAGGGDGREDISGILIDEFNAFVKKNLLGDLGSFARFFTANETGYHAELEDIYGGHFVPPDRIVWDERERKGVLGLAGLLAATAKEQSSDPVQRGLLVRLRILCEPMPPPIPNADLSKVGVTDQMQTRERYEALAKAPACRSCHMVINPPGYLFEVFDQVGRYREIEKGRPIDATGGIPAFFGQDPYPGIGSWSGTTALADWLAEAPQARLCFAREFTNYFLAARVFDRTDGCGLARLADRFVQGGKVSELVEDIVASPIFRQRVTDAAEPAEGVDSGP